MTPTINKILTKYNYNPGLASRIKYIVIHYTGNNGDTAANNCKYFQAYRGASAHYFVDENEICQSIEDQNIAWHCGTTGAYKHPECRNSNSLGIELCSRKESGIFYFKQETVENAVALVKHLMQVYNVPTENVIRHYDVTGKICPAPFVNNRLLWQDFLNRLTEPEERKEDLEVNKLNILYHGANVAVDAINKDGLNYIKLRDLEKLGMLVGYDADNNVPVVRENVKPVNVLFNGEPLEVEGYNIAGHNYIKLRDMVKFDLEVGFDSILNVPVILSKENR